MQKGDLDHNCFRALSRLIIDNASDIDIWGAVFDLINTLLSVTPPTTTAPTFNGTPATRSSSSFEGSEQTRQNLEPELFYEINNCTYRNVRGFFDKYFEGKSWSRESKKVCTTMKTHRKRGRWTGFPDPPEQDAVWEWLSRFQKKRLSRSRSSFYTTDSTSDLTGSETNCQVDVLLKNRPDKGASHERLLHGPDRLPNGKSAKADRQLNALMKARSSGGEKHDWKHVRVIGELKKAERWLQGDFKAGLLQLTRYVREVFSAQPTRRFVHGFLLCGRLMELWVFDRSGPYSSGPFDIHKEPEKFIRAIAGYAMMSDKELGFDTFIEKGDKGQFITIDKDAAGQERKIQLENNPFVVQPAIVCRGTNCWRTHDGANVAKFSWTSDKRAPEAELLQLARERGVKGIAQLVGYQHIVSIDELRNGLTFPSPHPFRDGTASAATSFSQSFGLLRNFSISEARPKRKHPGEEYGSQKRSRSNSQRSKLSQQHEAEQASKLDQQREPTKISLYNPDDGTYGNRDFGCLVISPAGQGLLKFTSITELLTVLRDAIKGHQSLLEKGKILHRDISENNIIITEPEQADGFQGILIDMDLAKRLGSKPSGARHKTGTMQFMAIEVLRGIDHTYRHDLESFFYVLLWICARRVWERGFRCKRKDRPRDSALKGWYRGTFKEIAKIKYYDMSVDGFKELLEEFPSSLDCVKPLCIKIRGMFFPILKDGSMDIGTPSAPPEKLYDAIIGAYDKAIDIATAEGK